MRDALAHRLKSAPCIASPRTGVGRGEQNTRHILRGSHSAAAMVAHAVEAPAEVVATVRSGASKGLEDLRTKLAERLPPR